MHKASFAAVLVVALVSSCVCGPPPDPTAGILLTDPAGNMGPGKPWAMTAATVSLGSNNTQLSVRLFGEPGIAPCQSSGATQDYILWSMPAKLGHRELQLDLFDLTSPDNQTITMYTQSTDGGTGVNHIIIDGILNVTRVDGVDGGTVSDGGTNMVTIGLQAKETSAGLDVNGTFTTTLCP